MFAAWVADQELQSVKRRTKPAHRLLAGAARWVEEDSLPLRASATTALPVVTTLKATPRGWPRA